MTNNGKQRTVTVAIEAWAFETPFRITGYTFSTADIVHVTITQDGKEGRGEAAGVYYLDESGESMRDQILSASTALEDGASREELRQLLPAGGARNAVDCALWDLEAKLTGKSIWELTGVEPGHTHSVMTVGIDTPAAMADKAAHLDSSKIKVKLSGENPLERIAAVRAARPDAEIIVDVNQGWNFGQLVELAPKFVDLGIAMIEQPLPRGGDAELEQASRRYQMINIKLDKTGGLTEALDLAAMAKDQGIELMVGNMMGTSLAMAPGFVIAQLCRFVDLDGPLFLSHDRKDAITYTHGVLSTPTSALWG